MPLNFAAQMQKLNASSFYPLYVAENLLVRFKLQRSNLRNYPSPIRASAQNLASQGGEEE